MKKILTIVGARPQFIKAAAVSKVIMQMKGLQEVILHTGQHFDKSMSQVFFEQMSLPHPAYNLGIKEASHGAMTAKMLHGIEEVLHKEKPDMVLVYGDTNSTLAGALAAAKLNTPVAHVEAGMRSYNMSMPEEINRTLTDRLSSLLFCSTQAAVINLEKEGFERFPAQIILSGDVMYDTALQFGHISMVPKGFDLPEEFLLATVHRAENTDHTEKLIPLMNTLSDLSEEIPVVMPLHPRTKSYLLKYNYPLHSKKMIVIEPQGYLEMLHLIKLSSMVMTDSGGLQKEAFFFEKPCITLREETEWTELLAAGCNILCGSDQEKINKAYKHFRSHPVTFTKGLYGNGKAAEIIGAGMQTILQ
jgi:UDP-GlcNAc3NAcA epimerase